MQTTFNLALNRNVAKKGKVNSNSEVKLIIIIKKCLSFLNFLFIIA